MNDVPLWTLDQLKSMPLTVTAMWVTPSCRAIVSRTLPFDELAELDSLAPGITLIVVGGGEMMDKSKTCRADHRPDVRLILVPSIFGSGAEVSPVVVRNEAGGKHIDMDNRYRPNARVYWPELLASVPAGQARDACGDVWSHALEAFISSLAADELRHEIAGLISEMLAAPLAAEPVWFDYSARACDAQARSGVGLIHGIAHTLEPVLMNRSVFGHAALCANLLWPVLRFNREHADKWQELVTIHGLDEVGIERVACELFDPTKFERIRELLAGNWQTVLRDRCTRMNGVLVRPSHLDYFLTTDFS